MDEEACGCTSTEEEKSEATQEARRQVFTGRVGRERRGDNEARQVRSGWEQPELVMCWRDDDITQEMEGGGGPEPQGVTGKEARELVGSQGSA